MKRAQVTLFIIIGVVALFMAGLMLYYVGLQAKKPATKFEDVTPIKNYVTSCVSKLGDEALILAGQQAGIIFASQEGQYPEFQSKHEDRFFNLRKKDKTQAQRGRGIGEPEQIAVPEPDENVVPTAVLRPEYNLAFYYANPYEYPWIYFPYTDAPIFSQKAYNGYFGLNVMPKLNKDDAPLSIQHEIESFIGSKLKECTNGFVLFPEYQVEEKEVYASVLFADEDTVINVTYPLEIRKKAGGEITKLSGFTTSKKVRMKKIHEVANWIINNDISDITYDVQQPGIFYGMDIERETVDANENVGTFITITDPESILNDKQYEFVFTRQNRNPALEYIKVSELKNMPSKCSFDDAKSVVNCDFRDVHKLVCTCRPGCCPICVHDYFKPASFTIEKSNFVEKAQDPDEDLISTSDFTYSPNLPYPYKAEEGASYNTKFQVKVSDGKLEDWQYVTFNVRWIREGCR